MENVKLALEEWELCWFVQQWKWVFHLHWLLNYLASRMKQAIFGMQTKCATVFIVFLSNFIQREPTTDKFTKTHIYLTCFSFVRVALFVLASKKIHFSASTPMYQSIDVDDDDCPISKKIHFQYVNTQFSDICDDELCFWLTKPFPPFHVNKHSFECHKHVSTLRNNTNYRWNCLREQSCKKDFYRLCVLFFHWKQWNSYQNTTLMDICCFFFHSSVS